MSAESADAGPPAVEMVYVGDTTYGKFGMFNSPLVTPANVSATGTGTPNTAWVSAAGG